MWDDFIHLISYSLSGCECVCACVCLDASLFFPSKGGFNLLCRSRSLWSCSDWLRSEEPTHEAQRAQISTHSLASGSIDLTCPDLVVTEPDFLVLMISWDIKHLCFDQRALVLVFRLWSSGSNADTRLLFQLPSQQLLQSSEPRRLRCKSGPLKMKPMVSKCQKDQSPGGLTQQTIQMCTCCTDPQPGLVSLESLGEIPVTTPAVSVRHPNHTFPFEQSR